MTAIDKDGFCIECQQPADWCVCPPEPEADGEPADIGADDESLLAALKAEVAKAAKDDKPAAAVRVLEQMIQGGMAAADRASVRKWIISQRLITAAEFDRITSRRTSAPAGAIDADPAPGEPLTDLGYARRLNQRLRGPAPLRARLAPLAHLGRRPVAARCHWPAPPVDEVDRPSRHRRRAGLR